jgi:hypothetical protein
LCLWRRFWGVGEGRGRWSDFGGWGKGEAGEVTEVLGVGEGRGRWSNGRPVSNRKPFSFSNQLLHFSLDTICLRLERKPFSFFCLRVEIESLRKIFLIMDYILPGCKGARDGRRSSWWCKKCVLIRVMLDDCPRVFDSEENIMDWDL